MNNISSFNLSSYNTNFVNELKYQVHKDPKKYSLKTANAVDGIFIQMLLKSMRSTLLKNDIFDNNQSRLYLEIYDEQIAKEISCKGIGISKIVLKQIESNNTFKKQ